MTFVDDDGTPMEIPDSVDNSCPMCGVMPGGTHLYIGCVESPAMQRARDRLDLEEAGRVAGLDLRAHDAPSEPIGAVTEAIMAAVREAVVEPLREHRRMALRVTELMIQIDERITILEQAILGNDFEDAAPPVNTLDIGDLPDRPLTPAEDRARAQRIADKARTEAAAMRAEDLRGIDQDAPAAPVSPVVDEVVIPVQGPKGGFRG